MSKHSEYQVAITPESHMNLERISESFDVSKRMHNDGFITVHLVPSLNEDKDKKEDNIIQLKPRARGIKGFFELFSK